MKQLLISTLLFTILVTGSQSSFAQEQEQQKTTKCKWVSDKGFWIVESNINDKTWATIHFYNNDNQRIYSEMVDGRSINIKKKRTLMKLKHALDSALVAWENVNKQNNHIAGLSNK
ncbi:hypothetical protein [Aridibaculum aurantiacum]|uniref:hypothetical protein n=1 Tax=Aridibaculum aurantiacum TaxID=2810307 RepID=UPI001A97A93B|nr:hypothetical protein [Aridibaculum aurantiacum]